MNKFDSNTQDDNPSLDAAFLSGMKPSPRGRLKLDGLLGKLMANGHI